LNFKNEFISKYLTQSNNDEKNDDIFF